MTRKLIALGLVFGMAGIAACDTRDDDPAFEDDFEFQEAPPATPAPAPLDTPMDTMMDTLYQDTVPETPQP